MAKTPQELTKAKRPPKTKSEPTDQSRKLKKPAYRSFRLHKRIKGGALPSAFSLLKTSFGVLGKHWKVFLGIAVAYGVLNATLVQGFQVANSLGDVKSTLDQLFTGNLGQLATGFTLFVYLVGGSGNTSSPAAGAYQLILTLIVSLALIWALRQMYVGNAVRVRDGFYQGMAPLVKFVLVLLVVGLQLLPMVVGLALYGTVTTAGIAVTGVEQVLWAVLAFGLSVLSLYLISSSLFALYIVTLPDMAPVKALRSARQLVANRRWSVVRKVVFLPIVLLVLAAIIVIPAIMFVTPLAPWLFFILTMLLLPIVHSYMYTLYRAML